jgi:DNA-binding CsgD family transcriptional regulator
MTFNDLLNVPKRIKNIDESEYQYIRKYIEFVKSLTTGEGLGIYIADTYKNNIIYVSNSLSLLLNVNSADICKKGIRSFLNYVPKEVYAKVYEMGEKIISFIDKTPIAERKQLVFSYNLHYNISNAHYFFRHILTPLALSPDGKFWLVLCKLSIPARNETGDMIARLDNSFYRYSWKSHDWETANKFLLAPMERLILIYSSQGYTANKLAKMFNKSVNTIKYHKKRLFKKLNADNMSEAILIANNYMLL